MVDTLVIDAKNKPMHPNGRSIIPAAQSSLGIIATGAVATANSFDIPSESNQEAMVAIIHHSKFSMI